MLRIFDVMSLSFVIRGMQNVVIEDMLVHESETQDMMKINMVKPRKLNNC